MNVQDDRDQAAAALASVRAHQEKARRAARVPWWLYVLMFVLTAGATAANDFVTITGTKVLAVVVLVLFVATLALTFVTGKPLLSVLRGVQPRQRFEPRVFLAVLLVACVAGWLFIHYGEPVTASIAGGVGLADYPDTVTGVLFGIVFTGVFALGQALQGAAARRAVR